MQNQGCPNAVDDTGWAILVTPVGMTLKELLNVSFHNHKYQGQSFGLTFPQHHETLKAEFDQLLEQQAQFTEKIAKLEQELAVCRGELDQHRDCEQLKEQVKSFVARVTAIDCANLVRNEDHDIAPMLHNGSATPPQTVRQITQVFIFAAN